MLQVCADTLIGDDQIRGVSGGQRKRVTTGQLSLSRSPPLAQRESNIDWENRFLLACEHSSIKDRVAWDRHCAC